MSLTYLASPYTADSEATMQERYEAACRVAARFNAQGRPCFSPIAHSHPLVAYEPSLGREYASWQAIDEAIIGACSEVCVLMIPGWEQSKGIKAELALADKLGKPITFVEPTA